MRGFATVSPNEIGGAWGQPKIRPNLSAEFPTCNSKFQNLNELK